MMHFFGLIEISFNNVSISGVNISQADVSPDRRQLAGLVSGCGCLTWIKCWTVCCLRVTRLRREISGWRPRAEEHTHTVRGPLEQSGALRN